jgi:biopolymer transport protein ExbB
MMNFHQRASLKHREFCLKLGTSTALAILLTILCFGTLATPGLGATNEVSSPAGTTASADAETPKLVAMPSWGQKLKDAGTTGMVQIGLSVFGASFVFERLFRLRRKHLVPQGLSRQARELWRAGKFDELEQLGEAQPSTLARVISFIAKNRNAPMTEVSEICGELVSRELSGHYQRAYPLGIVATLAPLLGLLGMILGMITTFETVAMAGSLGDPTMLAQGISEALVTTGLGLAIAIPFLALYHIFKFRTTQFGAELEEEVTGLLSAWLMKQETKAVAGQQ